jgi:uncharacterized membrane protein
MANASRVVDDQRLTALLAWLFVGATNLTGFTDDSSFVLSGLNAEIDPRGILLAGIVIGSLGVLDDVTVTQVSAVWQLKSIQPELTTVGLMRPAMRIGRDHISSTVDESAGNYRASVNDR